MYTFSVKRDTYVLVNKKTTTLSYKLHLYTDKTNVDTVKDEGFLLAYNNADYKDKVFDLLSDGIYKLEIIDGDDIYFESWIKLRNELISLLKPALCCACGCKGSHQDCMSKECKEAIANQSLLNMITVYQYLIKPFSIDTWLDNNKDLFDFYQTTFHKDREDSLALLGQQMFDCSLYGVPTTSGDLFKYNLAVYYLGLYFYAKSDTLLEDMNYLDEVYQYPALSKCIRKLGIDIEDVEGNFTEEISLVYYWQLPNPIDDINDIIPIFDSIYLSDKPFAEFPVFEEGKIINYNTVGRVAFAVDKTTGVDFELKDQLGNDITDDFDSEYFPATSTVLFVSKLVSSISNMYFRFKPL